MSTIGPMIDALGANAPTSVPRQDRSLASFARMLDATKELMLERGGEDFTLNDISERGNVSTGSIYLRFESKDRLIHAVIARELTALIERENAMLETVRAESATLGEFMPRYIDRYSEFLAANSALLRTIMQRASVDQAVSGPGKETARRSIDMAVGAILSFGSEVRGANPRTRAEAAFQVIFATTARQYGLGATAESGDEAIWRITKAELARMTLAYLTFED